MQVLTGEEVQRLLIQAKEDGCFELLLLELTTGLRRGEILALRWDDLDFRTGTLRVERQVQRIQGKLDVPIPQKRGLPAGPHRGAEEAVRRAEAGGLPRHPLPRRKSLINVYCNLCGMVWYLGICFDVLRGQVNFSDKIIMHINLLHPAPA